MEGTLLLVDFSLALEFIHRINMEQIQLPSCFSNGTVTIIMKLFKNTKTMVRSQPDDGIDFFYIIERVLKGYTLAIYRFIICQRMSIDSTKENGQTLKKQKAVDISQKLSQMRATQMI